MIKVNDVTVITNDRVIQNIESFDGELFFDGARRESRVELDGWVVDCAAGNYFSKVVTSTGMFSFRNFPTEDVYGFILELDYKGGAIAFPQYVHWSNDIVPNLLRLRTHVFAFIKDSSATEWFATYNGNFDLRKPPNPYKFPDVIDVLPNELITSDVLTITGLVPGEITDVIIDSGEVDAGTYELSGTYGPDQYVTASEQGTIVVRIRSLASAIELSTVNRNVTIGGRHDTWKITTRQVDATPDVASLNFTNLIDVEFNSVVDSETIMVTGLEPRYPVSISAIGATIDAGTTALSDVFGSVTTVTASPVGTIVLKARMITSPNELSITRANITVGTVTTEWTTTTRALDLTPDPSSLVFTDIQGVRLAQLVTSQTITVTGLEKRYPITVSATDGTIDVGSTQLTGTFSKSITIPTSSNGTLLIAARQLSSNQEITNTVAKIRVGTGETTWTIRTLDATPDLTSFVFGDVTGANLNSVITSDQITVTGVEPNIDLDITAVGGTISAGTVAISNVFASTATVTTSPSGSFALAARVTSSDAEITTSSVSITVGSTSTTWKVRTLDKTPDQASITFTATSGVMLNTVVTSDTKTVTGLEPNADISISAMGGSIDGGTTVLSGIFTSIKTIRTSPTGTMVIAARVTSSTKDSEVKDVGIQVGSGISSWSVKTVDLTPDAFAFATKSEVTPDTFVLSDQITVTGLEPNFTFTVTSAGGTIDAGTLGLTGTDSDRVDVTTSSTGTFTMVAKMKSARNYSADKQMTVTVGPTTVTWMTTTQPSQITTSVAASLFGETTAISGNTVAVGSYMDDTAATDAGRVKVYLTQSGTPTLQATLYAPDPYAGDMFGNSLDINGDILVVGAYGQDQSGGDTGAVYVFNRANSVWSYTQKLVIPDCVVNLRFGTDVRIINGMIVASGYTGSSVFIFANDGSSWTQIAELTPPAGEVNTSFGTTFVVDGDYIVVGAPDADTNGTDSGACYTYHNTGTAWEYVGKYTPGSAIVGAKFGQSMAVSNGYIVIGAPGIGSVYLYPITDIGSQTEVTSIFAGLGNGAGRAVAISFDLIAIGVVDPVSDMGFVALFARKAFGWERVQDITPPVGTSARYFGTSISIDGLSVIVGGAKESLTQETTPNLYVLSA